MRTQHDEFLVAHLVVDDLESRSRAYQHFGIRFTSDVPFGPCSAAVVSRGFNGVYLSGP